jgi:membrane protein DedA with SNARE-associated domain
VLKSVIGSLSLDPKQIFNSLSPYGEVFAWLIVFAETGLLLGFFLPGDSLLFTAGVLTAQMHPAVPLSLLLLTVPAAARQSATMSVR